MRGAEQEGPWQPRDQEQRKLLLGGFMEHSFSPQQGRSNANRQGLLSE